MNIGNIIKGTLKNSIGKGRVHPALVAVEGVMETMRESIRSEVTPSLQRLQKSAIEAAKALQGFKIGWTWEYRSGIDQALRALEMAKIETLYKWAVFIEGEAQDRAPVDTGLLRSSIAFKVFEDEGKLVVGANTDYAIFVHEGSSANGRQPSRFLEDAVTQNYTRLQQIMNETYKKYLGNVRADLQHRHTTTATWGPGGGSRSGGGGRSQGGGGRSRSKSRRRRR